MTGESIPVDKKPGDVVSAATLNQSGFIRCEATRVGEDTTLSQIIQMVSDAAATKAPIAKIADKVSGDFCTGGDHYCGHYDDRVAAGRRKCRFRFGERHFRTGYQLSVCPWSCHTGGYYGGQRYGGQEWYPL